MWWSRACWRSRCCSRAAGRARGHDERVRHHLRGQGRRASSCHGSLDGRWQVGTYVEHRAQPVRRPTCRRTRRPSLPSRPARSCGRRPRWAAASPSVRPTSGCMLGAPGVAEGVRQTYLNDGPHTDRSRDHTSGRSRTRLRTTGWFFDPMTFDPVSEPVGDVEGPAGVRRPTSRAVAAATSWASPAQRHDYTLPGGAQMTHSTETSYSGPRHPVRELPRHRQHGQQPTGAPASASCARSRSLDSQVCGQCHATATAKQKNYSGGTFSRPNGFTPDRKLVRLRRRVRQHGRTSFLQTSPTVAEAGHPHQRQAFYPDGTNKGGNHLYYNEWMLTPHARSLRWQDGTLWTAHAQDACLNCHSGEGFLKSIGYGSDGPNDIAIFPSIVASDTLDIECAVCHTVHAKTGDALGSAPAGRRAVRGVPHRASFPTAKRSRRAAT